MVLISNGGKLPLSEVADFEGFGTETWFSRDAMTNILSFRKVRSELEITYDGHSFIIYRAAKGFPDMVFKPHKSGLYVYDPNDPRELASHCFMDTVNKNWHSLRSNSFKLPSRYGISKRVWRSHLILI
jgi:hypothetical protein